MKFTKMHGIGNDYVYVNCFEETVSNPSAVAKFVSDRHFGIGSDGLILIKPSDVADCEMDMYNLDGSQGAMCGNGIRCVAKYAYDYGIVNKTNISVATKSGIKYLDLTLGDDGKVALVKVNMGAPILEAAQIPVDTKELKEYKGCEIETIAGQVVKTPVVDETIVVEGKEYKVTAASMGNPHAIVYLDKDIDIKVAFQKTQYIKNDFKQLSQDEAAEILNIWSKSVSRIKIRAIEKLRKHMEGDLEDGK